MARSDADAAHIYHGDLGCPEDSLFFDGCPTCEARADMGIRGLMTQDIDRVHILWDRMVNETRGDRKDGYRTAAEGKIGGDLYAFSVLLERAGDRDALRILSAHPDGSES